MSWLFSRALVAEYSAGTCSDGELSAQLSVMDTPHKFWRNDKTMAFSDLSRFGLTCAALTESRGEELLMSYLAGFRAKTSVQPGKALAWPASVPASGEKWRASWAKFDPSTSTWKTAQYSLLEGLESSLGTWPRWGSMQGGESYQQPTPVRLTFGSESGLWPAPVASDTGSRSKPYAQGGTPLSLAVKLWPTPTTMKSTGGPALCKWGGAGARKKMATMVSHAEMNGPLNPVWVEWLMGWPAGWSDLTPLAMDKFHEWQQQHSIS
jgi:hypothetical protein